MVTQTLAASEVGVTLSVTPEQPYARAPPPPLKGGWDYVRHCGAAVWVTPDTDVDAELGTRITMAQWKSRQEKSVTEEEE